MPESDPPRRSLEHLLTTLMMLAMATPQPETRAMPCRAFSTRPHCGDPSPADDSRALRDRIADLEDLLSLMDGSTSSDIRGMLRQCLADCRQRLGAREQSLPA